MGVKNVYSGGNTCLGFYHFYDTMAAKTVERKIILKGGPGTGKSSFIKSVGEHFAAGHNLEYHWCSSDPRSLDGLVINDGQICLVDGTRPHIIDPRYPGAIDEIINLGQFWDRKRLADNRREIISITDQIGNFFKLAYLRLQESNIARQEMQFYVNEAIHWPSAAKNILALCEDFMAAGKTDPLGTSRHLFAAAITPAGVVTQIDSLIKSDYTIFAVSGNPGSGIQRLFSFVEEQIELNLFQAEIYHNPFNPHEIDLILLPESKAALIDISANVIDYAPLLPGKYKRRLDFNLFIQNDLFAHFANDYRNAGDRYKEGLEAAIILLSQAKAGHDQLEALYIPNMDFAEVEKIRTSLTAELEVILAV